MSDKVVCPYCGNPAKLVSGIAVYPHRKDLRYKTFWQCAPCNAHVGTHKNSKNIPLGRLANEELRWARMKAHSAFDLKWRKGNRKEAYLWLAKQLGIDKHKCHIGNFDMETCKKVVSVATGKGEK